MDKITVLSEVTRVVVVSKNGVEFEKYGLYDSGVELHVQDEGQTLMIFPVMQDTE